MKATECTNQAEIAGLLWLVRRGQLTQRLLEAISLHFYQAVQCVCIMRALTAPLHIVISYGAYYFKTYLKNAAEYSFKGCIY